MVIFALAQSNAFSYKSHLDVLKSSVKLSENPHHLSNARKKQEPGFCSKLFSLLTSSTDVIDDTRNTFIKSYDDAGDKETQLDELLRCRNAFNWSDEELLDSREKSKKGKHNKSNLPKVKTAKPSLSQQAFDSIKKTVQGTVRTSSPNDFVLKRRKSDGDGSIAGDGIKDVEMKNISADLNTA